MKQFSRIRRRLLIIISIILIVTIPLFYFFYDNTDTTTEALDINITPDEKAEKADNSALTSPTDAGWTELAIKRSDTLSKLLNPFHIPYRQIQILLSNPLASKYLKHLYIGQTFFLKQKKNNHFIIQYSVNSHQTIFFEVDNETAKATLQEKPLTTALLFKQGIIHRNYSDTAYKAGLTQAMSKELVTIFSGTIDFKHGIKPGDSFSILYKEYYLEGKKDHPGHIIAASFTHRHVTHYAVRFTYPHNHTGYYTPDGHGVLSRFMRDPVKYKRISSHFTLRRFDPFLHIYHPHLGIDYAAPYGTPIHSLGDGVITFAGKKGGYGNAIIIRYSKKYRSLYGHMSRFAKHIHAGQRVKRGQIVGYIGSTGWSTGPHLHLSWYVYGIPRDPLKRKFVGGKSIPKSYLKTFQAFAKKRLDELKLYQSIRNNDER